MNRFFASLALAPCLLAGPPLTAADAPPVEVERAAERAIVRVVRVTGTVTSPRAALLSPSVGGLVAGLRVDAGDRVAGNDVVVSLDSELERLSLERAEAEQNQAQTALEDSRRRLAEAERVGTINAIPESQIKSLRAEVRRDEAALAAAEAAVRQQRAVVRRHDVRAPFAGVISRRLTDVGEWVSPGDGLVELVDVENLRFDFRVPQEYYSSVTPRTRVELSSDAVPGFSAEGRIGAIVPVKDPGARTFLLRVLADAGPGAAVTPGMSARAALHIDEDRTGVVVPRDALLRYPDGRLVVWVVNGERELPRVSERQVQTGLQFDGVVEIREGLQSGELVVTRGNEALQDGQSVSIQSD